MFINESVLNELVSSSKLSYRPSAGDSPASLSFNERSIEIKEAPSTWTVDDFIYYIVRSSWFANITDDVVEWGVICGRHSMADPRVDVLRALMAKMRKQGKDLEEVIGSDVYKQLTSDCEWERLRNEFTEQRNSSLKNLARAIRADVVEAEEI